MYTCDIFLKSKILAQRGANVGISVKVKNNVFKIENGLPTLRAHRNCSLSDVVVIFTLSIHVCHRNNG